MKTGFKTIIAVCISASLMACTSTGEMSKEGLGTGIGLLTGALIGKNVGGDKGAIIGGVLGGVVGNRIGANLDEKDRLALAAKTEDTLNHAAIGETVHWKSDHTTAQAELTPIKSIEKDEKATFTLYETRGDRESTTALNVREGPGASYKVITTLSKGSKVSTFGVTENGWYRIGSGNGIIGFVHGSYLRDISKEARSTAKKNNIDVEAQHAYVAVEKPLTTSVRSEELTVITRVTCKTVRVRTKVNGHVQEQHVETCQNPDGSWGA